MLIKDRMVVDGGWIERPEITCFNMYRPPRLELGDAAAASPWLEHLHTIYDPEAAAHILRWLAHRVQRPHEKINHGLVLGGGQGIGKDTLLEAVKQAVGPWNFHEISPGHLLGQFNSYRQVRDPEKSMKRAILAISIASLSMTTRKSTLRRLPTCCGSMRRICENIMCSTASGSFSRPTTRPTAYICLLMIDAILWLGHHERRRNSPERIGASCGIGIRMEDFVTSPPISLS